MKSLLENENMWCRCFALYNQSFVNEKLLQANYLLDEWCTLIVEERASLQILKELFQGDNKDRFVRLSLASGHSTLTTNTLIDLEGDVNYFTTLHRQTHDFVNHFCQNDNVDCSSLRGLLNKLDSSIAARVPFIAIKSSLNNQPFLKELRELTFLGKSELFLNLWNTTIDNTVTGHVNGEKVLLEVVDLKNKVFNTVTNRWIYIHNILNLKTISFRELEEFFSDFNSEDETRAELEFLKRTCKVENIDDSATSLTLVNNDNSFVEWCAVHASLIYNFIYLVKQKNYIPLVISVIKKFKTVFSIPVSEDEYFNGLCNLSRHFEEKWNNGTLFDVANIINDAKNALKHLQKRELDLIEALDKSDDLLDWLWHHNNTGQFNELIRVCREVTADDAITLQSFASLISCREYLFEIVYPEKKFSSCDSFLRALQAINNRKEDKDVVRKIQDVSFIRCNLETVKHIFRDKTRSPSVNSILKVIEIMDNGRFYLSTGSSVSIDSDESLFEDVITFNLPNTNKRSLISALIDARTTVLNTTIPVELKEKHTNLDETIELFSQLVNILISIKQSLIGLIRNGNISIDNYEYHFFFDKVNTKQVLLMLSLEDKKLTLLNTAWKMDVKSIRYKHRYLNYFNMRELRKILSWLEKFEHDRSIPNHLYSLFKIIRRNITKDHLSQFLKEWKGRNSVLIPEDISGLLLERLGSCLSNLFDSFVDTDVKQICFKAKTDTSLSLTKSKEVLENVFVIACKNEQDVESVVLSLYAVQSRLPEMYEVFMCQSNTSLEDIHLLFMRWSQASSYFGSKANIYTLANVHLLPYTIQCQVVDSLKSFLQDPNIRNAPSLVIVSGNAQQRIVTAFSNFRFDGATITLSDEEIKDVYQQICDNYSYGVTVFTSNSAGGGKTQSLHTHAAEKQLQVVCISLRECVDLSSLISQLNDKANVSVPIALYFNISTHVDPIVNSVIFQLIAIGSISDYRGNIYHRREADSIYIEIPNSPQQLTIRKLLPICNFLPRQNCMVSRDSLVTENACSLDDLIMPNTRMSYVCSVLEAFNNGTFDNMEQFIAFRPSITMDKQKCFDILMRYCVVDGQTSYSLISNFIDFTFNFIEPLMNYEFLRIIVSFEQSLSAVTRSVISLILEMTKDFAVRQLTLNCNENPSLEEYSTRFSTIRKWEQSSHPVLVFSYNEDFTVSGFNVIALHEDSVQQFFTTAQIEVLKLQGMDIKFDFKKSISTIGQEQTELAALKFVMMVNGTYEHDLEEYNNMMLKEQLEGTDYVLTQDNLMKMFAILLRFKCNLPVILLGESGCSKTYLITFLCSILGITLHRITLHGGHTENDIINFLTPILEYSNEHSKANYIVFFDECNTCAHSGIIKEIVCDRLLNGMLIPTNVKIVCALNPYRLKSENSKKLESAIQSQTGILYKHPSFKNIPDPLENLVYRVHPLPDSFVDHVFDFGSLTQETEREYIRSMLHKSLKKYYYNAQDISKTLDFFVGLIHTSQQFIRDTMFEPSAVSLRDVRRCVTVFSWLFDEHKNGSTSVFSDILDFKTLLFHYNNETFVKILILTLGFTYYSRLNREKRRLYLRTICEHSNMFKLTPQHFVETIEKYQLQLCKQMNPGDGIALNEALTENIFMLFLALMNHIPLILVGFAGSSKSLAVDLLSKAMRGKASTNKKLHHLPDINIFAYQCSPLSEAKGIQQTFKSARRYAEESTGTSSLSVVLLDEISLADSPKLPLKILHQELEDTKNISFVAISNYSLDSSKMNRMCILYRSIPTSKDLKNTAKGIIGVKKLQLNSYLESIAQSYLDLFNSQKITSFFGLRDYYQCIAFLNRLVIKKMTYRNREMNFDEALLLSILRNFGGVPKDETQRILKIFETKTGISLSSVVAMPRPTNKELIEMNLDDKSMARHLMLLTTNNAALPLLFDCSIVNLSDTLVLFGSDFPEENNDNFALSLQLQKIKLAMSDGKTVVLVHCESLYESLYDLLNQHYVVVEQKKFARLAFGESSVMCSVHDEFRIIVIAEASDAYTKLAAPFLNRLEKHTFNRDDMMNDEHSVLMTRLENFIETSGKFH